MPNEAVHALFKNYSEEDGMDIRFLGTGNGARYFADFVQNGDYYADDAPDMMLKKGNEVIIIEHFEFDSYHVDRKGSPGRREMARIQRNEDSVEATEDGVLFSDEIKGKSSFRDLLTNLCRSFKEHYSRIPKYKENLKGYGLIDDSTQVKVLFLVEDVSPLGSIVIDGKKQRPIIMLLCKEFLDLFRETVDLDYVLSCSSAAERNFVWFADRSEIEEYYKCAVDYYAMAQYVSASPDYPLHWGGRTGIAYCKSCGNIFIKNGNRQKYCDDPECKLERDRRKSKDYYYRKIQREKDEEWA